MKCIKCGVNLNQGASYCIRCGSYQDEIQQENNKSSQNIRSDKNINYDILERSYVGKKYNSFIYSRFSWLCFLFGPLYTLSRKMYSFSIIYLLVVSIVFSLSGLVTWWFQLVSVIVINCFFSYIFKKSYLEKVKTRVNKIVLDNPNLDMVMLQEKCRKKGGLNWFFVVICSLFALIGSTLLLYISITGNTDLIKNTKQNYYESEITDICLRTKNNALFISSQEFKIDEVYSLNSIIGLENYKGSFTLKKDDSIELIDVKIKDQICSGICPSNIKCK